MSSFGASSPISSLMARPQTPGAQGASTMPGKSPLIDQIDAVKAAMPFGVAGRVDAMSGLTIEAVDLALPIGSMCRIQSFGGRELLAEVIGIRQERTLLMPLSS